MQFQLVAILGLLALFTHNHAFWVAGLVLAFIDLPDLGTPLRQIAGSLERIASSVVGGAPGETTSEPVSEADASPRSETAKSSTERDAASRSDRPKVRVEA